jgi:hypothetical protein
VADYAIDLLRNPDKLTAQRERLSTLVAKLDAPGASQRVAQMALAMLESNGHADAFDRPVSGQHLADSE